MRTIVAGGNTIVNAIEQPGDPGFVRMSLQFWSSGRLSDVSLEPSEVGRGSTIAKPDVVSE